MVGWNQCQTMHIEQNVVYVKNTFDIGNMGFSEIKSHEKSSLHCYLRQQLNDAKPATGPQQTLGAFNFRCSSTTTAEMAQTNSTTSAHNWLTSIQLLLS